MNFRNILKKIKVIQEVDNKNRNPQLGKGFSKAIRLNPYNPLSYIVIVFMFLIGIIMFGVVGIWKEVDRKNPFKWY
jgi:hypothetical protein